MTTTPQRIALTKTQLSTADGAKLVDLCLELGLDGEFCDTDLGVLARFIAAADQTIPAVAHLRALITDAVADGAISSAERSLIHRQIERILPPTDRERLVMAREEATAKHYEELTSRPVFYEPSEAQLRYIEDLGGKLPAGASKAEASDLIENLLHSHASITPRQHMVLRFWAKQPEAGWGKSDVSAWMDDLYNSSPDHLTAWELYKEANGDAGLSRDPSRIPFGCGAKWLAKVRNPQTSGRGCLVLLILCLVTATAGGSLLFVESASARQIAH
jgi:hypothetical protein